MSCKIQLLFLYYFYLDKGIVYQEMLDSINQTKFNCFIENINQQSNYNLFYFYKLIGLSYISPNHLIENHTPNQIGIKIKKKTLDDTEYYILKYYFKFAKVSFHNITEWIKMIFTDIHSQNMSFQIKPDNQSISLRIRKIPLFFNQDTFWLKLFYRYHIDSTILSNTIFQSVLLDYDFLIHHYPSTKLTQHLKNWNWQRKKNYIMIIEQSKPIHELLYIISILNTDIKSIIYLYL